MRQSGLKSSPSQSHGLKLSFQDAMASLLNAIAPSRSAPHRAEVQAEPEAAPHVAAESTPGPTTMLAAEPSVRYDIADALADVAEAIAPKPAVAPKATIDAPAPDIAPKIVALPKVVALPTVVTAPKAAVPPKVVAVPKTAAPPKVALAPTAVAKPVVEARNDWQPVSIAPLDRNVQVGITFKNGILAIFFPCRRTEAGWINAIVKAPLLHDPACWREWREDYFEAN
jgi:hypothetical protein